MDIIGFLVSFFYIRFIRFILRKITKKELEGISELAFLQPLIQGIEYVARLVVLHRFISLYESIFDLVYFHQLSKEIGLDAIVYFSEVSKAKYFYYNFSSLMKSYIPWWVWLIWAPLVYFYDFFRFLRVMLGIFMTEKIGAIYNIAVLISWLDLKCKGSIREVLFELYVEIFFKIVLFLYCTRWLDDLRNSKTDSSADPVSFPLIEPSEAKSELIENNLTPVPLSIRGVEEVKAIS